MQEINFNGRELSEFCCVITEPQKRPFPKRRYEKITVPGRNGDLVLDDECYENISLTYVFLSFSRFSLLLAVLWLLRSSDVFAFSNNRTPHRSLPFARSK